MRNFPRISSMQNPKIKQLVRLRDRRERDRSGLFLIEGYRELTRALGRVELKTLFISPDHFLGENEPSLIAAAYDNGAMIVELDRHVFEKASYRDRPDGLLGVARQFHYSLESLDRRLTSVQSPLVLIVEAIEKPGNLGSILRSADAAGVHGLIVCDRCTDIFNPNVVRASVGTIFSVPIIEAMQQETFSFLERNRLSIVATTPAAESEFTQTNMTGPVAVLVGSEQYGLSDFWLNVATSKVRIPMVGVADSLNVATATTLLLYEVVRQRRTPT